MNEIAELIISNTWEHFHLQLHLSLNVHVLSVLRERDRENRNRIRKRKKKNKERSQWWIIEGPSLDLYFFFWSALRPVCSTEVPMFGFCHYNISKLSRGCKIIRIQDYLKKMSFLHFIICLNSMIFLPFLSY